MPRPTPEKPRPAAAPLPGEPESSLRFSLTNLALLAAGAVAIVLGYVLLNGGDTVAAPLLLVLGYAVLIPLGIIL
ncbi:MAG TPA: hypothetical protein VFX98_19215 [Longimicrobiaceae bacterium]|nr:hypothetical protein [Longimicrobiaceae bacterium]